MVRKKRVGEVKATGLGLSHLSQLWLQALNPLGAPHLGPVAQGSVWDGCLIS